jgi:hypothetical protein
MLSDASAEIAEESDGLSDFDQITAEIIKECAERGHMLDIVPRASVFVCGWLGVVYG